MALWKKSIKQSDRPMDLIRRRISKYPVLVVACWICTGLILLLVLPVQARAAEAASDTDMMDGLERRLELERHQQLLQKILSPGGRLADFTTDGCSGGLSAGWSYLVAVFPGAREVHGDQPPWESCCITHDRAYHAGGLGKETAEESFTARRTVDRALEACVLATGSERSETLSQEYGLTQGQITDLYRTIAALMYRAVRIGGVPCSRLPWRWGYGWPQCD
jgi:hypothetical protein